MSRCQTCNAPDTWDGMHDQATHALADRLAALEARLPAVTTARGAGMMSMDDINRLRVANGFAPKSVTSEPTPPPGNSGIPEGWKLGDGWARVETNPSARTPCEDHDILEPIAEPASPPVTEKLSESVLDRRLTLPSRENLSKAIEELETALDAAKREQGCLARHREQSNKLLLDAADTLKAAQAQLATRDARIAGLEASAAEDSKARAALEARCAAAEHDTAVLKERVKRYLTGGDE